MPCSLGRTRPFFMAWKRRDGSTRVGVFVLRSQPSRLTAASSCSFGPRHQPSQPRRTTGGWFLTGVHQEARAACASSRRMAVLGLEQSPSHGLVDGLLLFLDCRCQPDNHCPGGGFCSELSSDRSLTDVLPSLSCSNWELLRMPRARSSLAGTGARRRLKESLSRRDLHPPPMVLPILMIFLHGDLARAELPAAAPVSAQP